MYTVEYELSYFPFLFFFFFQIESIHSLQKRETELRNNCLEKLSYFIKLIVNKCFCLFIDIMMGCFEEILFNIRVFRRRGKKRRNFFFYVTTARSIKETTQLSDDGKQNEVSRNFRFRRCSVFHSVTSIRALPVSSLDKI